ncbi:helix-turn-helix transcriptional regulator [Providencia alcalifaciens]|uniref:helix-turn-helix transcriptional regulator n=1 Tax=Providencia alcalifaciens TaxID=126385 RepID=UPI001CC82F42|nr:AraC family transcriptional regulator [Providencia alcalifaciens]CAG9425020.1 Exoenzyme S synthesis regulatory protein ExsA [Providencia alcalifaciens]
MNSKLSHQVIKKVRIDKSNPHAILDLTSKGLIIIEKGSILLETPAANESLHEGDILYHKQGSYSFKTENNTLDGEFLWISLDDKFLREYLSHYGSQLSEIERTENAANDIIKFTTSPLINELKNSLEPFIQTQYPELILKLRINELLLLLSYSEQGATLLSNLRQLSNRQAERLQTFMENNYLKEWKLNEFARTFGMGLTTFKELFHTVYATSPRSWISEKRIMYAHQLLINTSMSIVEVSMEAGFSSQSYFTQSYHRRFGYTPSRSRKAA